MFIVWSVLLMQNWLNFLDYFFLAAPELIRAGLILEVSPEALDRVQFSTVSRQPDAHYPMLKEAQGCQRSNTFVVRSTIQNQDEATGWVLFDLQVLQKGNESFAVLPLGNHPFDVVVDPVIGAKNVAALFLLICWQRDALLLTHFHPACSQDRVQAQGRFVHKEELEIVLEAPFLSSSRSSRACSLASGSCR